MGSENLFHKRKAKAAERLERKQSNRAPYDKVLIVCEGEKTEPNYFREIIKHYRLSTANIAVDGSCGSSPMSVFERAVYLWDIENKKGDSFDRVYCVIDKDSHSTYCETKRRIADKKPSGVFFSAASVPCFEYWLLLHFKYTTQPYAATGSLSIGHQVLKELKERMPEYTKGRLDVFKTLYPKLEFAKANAAKSLLCADSNHTDNPSTYIHELVEYLQNLKKP